MPVIFKGGTSGNREDALPKMNESFDRAIPQDTSLPSNNDINIFPSQNTAMGTPGNTALFHSDVPGGGTNPILTTEKFGPDGEGLRCDGGTSGDGKNYCPDMPTSGTPDGGPV